MAGWLGQIPAFAAAAALLVLPGLPMALLLRLRGLLLLGGAVIGSLASIGGGSLLAPLLGIGWSLLPVGMVALAITVIAAVLWSIGRGGAGALRGGDDRRVWASLGLALLGWTLVLTAGINGVEHPSQLYDGLFHLNAVEFIRQTGDASAFHMTMVVPGAETSFYPTLWHALVSLVVPVAGGVVAATNVVTIAVIAIIWPVALAALAGVLFPSAPGAAFWTPLAAFGFSVFPLGFLNWGVLYPSLLGTLQMPLLIAFVLMASRPALPAVHRVGMWLLAVAAAASTALGHPSALLGAVALLVPYFVWRAVVAWRAGSMRTRILIVGLGSVAALGLAGVWLNANVTTNEWLPSATLAQSLGEVAFLSPVGRSTGLLLGPLAAVGIWRVVRDRLWWVLWSHAVAIGLFLAAAWFPVLPIRSVFVGVWYDDTTRVAAMLALMGLPLAGLGATAVADALRGMRDRGRGRRALALLAVVAVLGATHLLAIRNDVSTMRNVSFRFDLESQGLSSDEALLFAEADAVLSDDSRVIGDPLTGAALLYAYTGHDVVFPHVTGRYSPDAGLLARSLRSGGEEVCTAVLAEGVTHVLDFGDRELFENHYTTFDGLHGLDDVPILTEIARVGDAAIYEVTGCV